nr:MBL fold metallo-hydrolase [Desulfobacterales bacterium]
MKIFKKGTDLYLIGLDQNITGFTDFIGSWLYNGEKTFLVDVGPSATIPYLIEALKTLGINHLDYILLTHIHLDHAGGIGHLAPFFPETPIVVHKKGIPHLIDPATLWEGTIKVVGDMARAYGPIKAVRPQSILDASQLASPYITPVMTPGHAVHHVSYICGPYLFAGETSGVYQSFPNSIYLRPATPPKFMLEVSIKSIDELLSYNPEIICFGHFGNHSDPRRILEYHRDQLLRWEEIIKRVTENYSGEDIEESCFKKLLNDDPLLSPFEKMQETVKTREHFFLKNSIKGFLDYISRK